MHYLLIYSDRNYKDEKTNRKDKAPFKSHCVPQDNRDERPGKVLMVKIDNATIFHKFYLWMSKLRLCYFIRNGSSAAGGQSLISKIIKINDLLMKKGTKESTITKDD